MDSSEGSTSDSNSDESTPAQIASGSGETQGPAHHTPAPPTDDSDSESDVSMSADSDDDEDEAPGTSAIQMNPDMDVLEERTQPRPADSTVEITNKRKFPDATEDMSNGIPQETWKRLKPNKELQSNKNDRDSAFSDKSLLPAEIWHYIFTFLHPRDLGHLLSVNKSFNAFLDPSTSGPSVSPLPKSAVSLMKPDTIWQAARRLFLPGMPHPLSGKSELDMFKLSSSPSCQFCGKKKQLNQPVPSDLWHPGPGEDGVISIWSFGVASCGSCLQQRCMKVVFVSSFVNFFMN